MSNTRILREIGESMLYIASLLGDRPRPIDRYIDYFGDPPRCYDVMKVR